MDGHLRPYASATGDIVWDFNTGRDYDTVNRQKAHGGLLEGEGPALAAGTEYAYSGYGQWGGHAAERGAGLFGGLEVTASLSS